MRAVVELTFTSTNTQDKIFIEYGATSWDEWSAGSSKVATKQDLGESSGECERSVGGTLSCMDQQGNVVLELYDFPFIPQVSRGDGKKKNAAGNIPQNSDLFWEIKAAPQASGKEGKLDKLLQKAGIL
ncbi:MAG: hypothetical protein HY000_38875 [Planctomycetes bacterium]|nr:hypothetical protein [Planctomycetota bacterium]